MRASIGKFAAHMFFKGREEDQGEEAGEISKLCIQSIVSVGMIPCLGLQHFQNIQRNS